jgi:hypothetical protein
VSAHAGAQVAVRIPDEVLGHRDVACRLGRVPVAEGGEMCAETRVITGFGAATSCCTSPCSEHRSCCPELPRSRRTSTRQRQSASVNGDGRFS